MIINKASEERGLAHGSIFKSEFLELDEASAYFCRDPKQPKLSEALDTDGLPYQGRLMTEGEPFYCYYSPDESKYVTRNFKGREVCYVHSVRLCGQLGIKSKPMACLTLRVPVSYRSFQKYLFHSNSSKGSIIMRSRCLGGNRVRWRTLICKSGAYILDFINCFLKRAIFTASLPIFNYSF